MSGAPPLEQPSAHTSAYAASPSSIDGEEVIVGERPGIIGCR
ncbi:MAG TPA: hypothetical protein VK932_15155 [Kofleriaceae bacterium]|nr:hypothetical protein [Kofleriaceae bacterium]